jgi:hypothetical protein
VLLHALADVVFLDLGEAEPDELVPSLARQPVERRVGGLQMGRERDTEASQQLRAVDAGRKDMLLDLGLHRLAVDGGGEGQQVDRILGRQRDVLVLLLDPHLRHRKRDQDRDVARRLVEEAVADIDLLGRDRQILGAHLHIVVLHENEPAGGELGRGIVGRRGRGHAGRRQQGGCGFQHAKNLPVAATPAVIGCRGRKPA